MTTIDMKPGEHDLVTDLLSGLVAGLTLGLVDLQPGGDAEPAATGGRPRCITFAEPDHERE